MAYQLSRRVLLTTITGGLATLAWPFKEAHAAGWSRYQEIVVIDGLGSPGSGNQGPGGEPLSDVHVQDVRESGLACVHLTILPVGTTAPDAGFRQAVEGIAHWEGEIDKHPEAFARVRSVADITAARQAARVGLLYGFQDAVAFETDLSRLDVFHRLGVRVIQPTYNRRNLLGDGCMEPANAGLSRAGHEAIEKMNALGILVDLSHCGRQTAADALAASRRPVAFTHTGCQAMADHPRNRTDAELRAAADTGGVSGIYVMPYLCGGRQPTAADVIRHVEHALKVAGEEHVSIGTDGSISAQVVDDRFKQEFVANVRARRDAGIAAPGETETGYLFAADLNTPRRFETLADMLAARGHPSARIEKILGANLLRVFRETWN